MRKMLSGAMAVLLAFLLFCPAVVVGADEGEDTIFPGIAFDSMAELLTYLQENRVNNSFWEDAVGRYLQSMESIHVPALFSDRDPDWVAVTYTYTDVRYEVEGTLYQMQYYYSPVAGQRAYDEAKNQYEEQETEYCPAMHKVGDTTVYAYYVHEETWYHWQEGGSYFSLRVGAEPEESHLTLCNVVERPLQSGGQSQVVDEAYLSDNPPTGR